MLSQQPPTPPPSPIVFPRRRAVPRRCRRSFPSTTSPATISPPSRRPPASASDEASTRHDELSDFSSIIFQPPAGRLGTPLESAEQSVGLQLADLVNGCAKEFTQVSPEAKPKSAYVVWADAMRRKLHQDYRERHGYLVPAPSNQVMSEMLGRYA